MSLANLVRCGGLLLLAATACGRQEPEPPPPPPVTDTTTAAAPWFREITGEAGLDFQHRSALEGGFFIQEHIGSGGALFDYDGDGDLDVFLVDSAADDRLYRHDAGGRFVDRTASAGLGDAGYGMGSAVGDVDNDGDLDLFVTHYGRDAFYLNAGDGTFAEATASAGLGDESWSTAACFFDAEGDGDLDLYVVTYVLNDPPKVCTDRAGRPEYCGPAAFRGEPDLYYRNRGDGTFARARGAGPGELPDRGLGVVCADLDGDGRDDVYVANDGEINNLWINRGDGTFEDRSVMLGVAANMLGQPEASMGVGLGDLDGDLDLDLFLAHLDRETNTLYVNLGGGFQDATAAWDLGRDSLPFTGFGTAFFDAENDGDLDLLIANGRVRRGPTREDAELADGVPDYWRDYAEPNLFFVQEGGRFHNRPDVAGELAGRVEVSRGLMLGDLDFDGGLDVLLTNSNGPARFYRNEAPDRGHWLVLRAYDPALERDAVGALVDVKAGGTARRGVVTSTYSYLAAVEPFVHFGLGAAAGVQRVTVHWPDGVRQRLVGLPADRRVVVFKPRSPAP